MWQIWWKQLAIAGVAGCACSYMYSHLKTHPKVVWPILQGSLAAGLVGTGVGLAAASYRNLSPVSVRIRAASVGVNFTIATAAFLGIREGVVYVHRGAFGKNQTALLSPAGDEYLTSCVSGAITGTLLSVLSRLALKSVLTYSIAGAAVGVTGQCLYFCFGKWRLHQAIKLYHPELTAPKSRQWTLDRFIEFMNRTSKLALASEKLRQLEETVEMEKARITELDRLLAPGSNNGENE